MKCPRCGLAELNDGHCIVCGVTVEPRRIHRLRLKLRRLSFAPSTRALWELNLTVYHRTKMIMLMFAVLVFVTIMTLVLESVGRYFVGALAAWFALMAFYDFYKTHEAKKK